jgi:hypothetical protein
MKSKILTAIMVMAAVASIGYVSTRTATAKANKSCCFEGSPCCFKGSACCEDESEKTAVKLPDCCYEGSPCCANKETCCMTQK